MQTLYYVLTQFTKLIAPMVPFIAEEMYQALDLPSQTKLASVHFDFYPKVKKLDANHTILLEQMVSDREVVSNFLAERITKQMPVRQPLASLKTTKKVYFKDIVKEEVNVKEVIDGVDEDVLDTNLTQDLKLEGMAREMVRKIQDLRKEQGLVISDEVVVTYKKATEIEDVVAKFSAEIMKKTMAVKLEPGEDYSVRKV